MKAKIFVDQSLLEIEDGNFKKWWNDTSKIESLDVHAWYDSIKICFNLEDDTTLCYEDALEETRTSDIYGKVEWGDHYLMVLKGKNQRPTLQYYGRKLPFVRKVSLHFKKDELTSFEINGIDKTSF